MPELIELIRHCQILLVDTGQIAYCKCFEASFDYLMFGTTSLSTGPYGGSHVHLIISPLLRLHLSNH